MNTLPDESPQNGEATEVLAADHARRFAFLRSAVRSLAYRIGAECERLMAEPYISARPGFKSALGDSFRAARSLATLSAGRDGGDDPRTGAEARLNAEARQSLGAVIIALTPLLAVLPTTVEEELAFRDIRVMRDDARRLLGGWSTLSPADDPRAAAERGGRGAFRIIIADDDQSVRDVLCRHLKGLGYEVQVAENGQVVLDLLEDWPADLIVTDIFMPVLDGLSLLRALKGSEQTREIPVIVVSGESDLQTVASVIEAGAEEHILKPFQPVLLRARVRATLDRKRLRDAELDHLGRIAMLTRAAEAVETDSYLPGALSPVMERDDEIGRLARVFDRMVVGLKSRQERLERRLGTLRLEVSDVTTASDAIADSAQTPFSPGLVLSARYEIESQIGRGGMGMVYVARDRELGERVAIKVIRGEVLSRDPTIVDRLKGEILLSRKISHPKVVRIHDIGESDGMFFLSMELVRGISIAELLDRRGRLTPESTLAIGTQLCEALAVAHDAQILHRDIKPANLMVDTEGGLKVMDFGVARSLNQWAARVTAVNEIVGTPHYMSPEQLLDRPVDTRSDIFSVGVVLYECLTGRLPFAGDSPIELMAAMLDEEMTPLNDLLPDLSPRLAGLVHQQLRFNPDDRARSAGDLGRHLGEIELLG